jgi:protein-disulfide isomerase
MAESKPTKTKKEKAKYPSNILIMFLASLSVGLAFFSGTLWAKVQMYEKGLIDPTKVANLQKDTTTKAESDTPTEPTEPTKVEVTPVTDKDHMQGDSSAQIVLIEYSDTECPYCKQFHTTAQKLVEEYPNQVMWVYRHFPLEGLHKQARTEAIATECAAELGGESGFWALINKIYETTTSNDGLDLETIPEMASEVGLDKAAFQECWNSEKTAEKVEEDLASGIKAGIRGTPGSILLDTRTGETKSLPGALPLEQMKQLIDEMLAK